MAYIDITKITDINARRIVAEDSSVSDDALLSAELDTRVIARSCEVVSADIPLTVDGFLQSEMLYLYTVERFLYHLFSATNGSYKVDDIYFVKMQRADKRSFDIGSMLSYSIITELEVTAKDERSTGIPIL